MLRERGSVYIENLIMKLAGITETLSIDATQAFAMRADGGGEVLYEKDADTVVSVASITKVLTALTVDRWVTDYSDTYTVVSDDEASGGESTAQLQAGDVVTLEDLMYGMAVASGNDAARGLSRHVGQMMLDAESGGVGDPIARFATEMQDVADDLGLASITAGDNAYASMSGSARDIAYLFKALADIPILETFFGTASHTMTITGGRSTTYQISNSTVSPMWEGQWVASKTGAGGGGNHLVMKADRLDRPVIAVALGASSTATRNLSLRNILDSIRE